jgi:hypothetical protein
MFAVGSDDTPNVIHQANRKPLSSLRNTALRLLGRKSILETTLVILSRARKLIRDEIDRTWRCGGGIVEATHPRRETFCREELAGRIHSK